jgi:hypothetical protein
MPTPMPRDNGVVVFHPSTGGSADIAAELTTALTMRMKPPLANHETSGRSA